MKKGFLFLFEKLRLGKPWKYKFPLLLSFTYIWLILANRNTTDVYIAFFASICTACGFAAFGYILNDWSDLKSDELALKKNALKNLGKSQISVLLLVSLAFALLPWFYLPVNKISIYLIIIELSLFILYSFPPFRLKERGFLGIIVDSSYAHVIPALLASLTFYLFSQSKYFELTLYFVILGVWQLISGIRNIFSHQVLDLESDRISGTRTFAGKLGFEKSQRIQTYIFVPLEILTFTAFIVFIFSHFPYGLPTSLIVLILSTISFIKEKKYHDSLLKVFTNNYLDGIYCIWLPVYFLVILGFQNSVFWPLLIIHLFLFTNINNWIRKLFGQ